MTECTCPKLVPTRRVVKGGRVTVFLQCPTCGSGRAAKVDEYKVDSLPPYDEGLKDRYWQAQKQETMRQWAAEHPDMDYSMAPLLQSKKWWESYNVYLKSEAWQRVRSAVLARDKVCQRCFEYSAQQAHHLTYATYNKHGFTFPAECVGVCLNCHASIHPENL